LIKLILLITIISLIAYNSKYGLRISIDKSEYKPIQNSNDLKKIWMDRSKYFQIVDTREIVYTEFLLEYRDIDNVLKYTVIDPKKHYHI